MAHTCEYCEFKSLDLSAWVEHITNNHNENEK